MNVQDLFAIMAIAGGVALFAMVVHAVWRIVVDDLRGKNEHEEDEHATGLPPPWLRKKR